jgi:hypothetical protein
LWVVSLVIDLLVSPSTEGRRTHEILASVRRYSAIVSPVRTPSAQPLQGIADELAGDLG